MKERDIDSRYFHSMASARKKKNTIIRLRNAQGLWCVDSDEIDTLIKSYFTDLFSSSGSNNEAVISALVPSISS